MGFKFTVAIVFFLCASTAQAAGLLYDCDITQRDTKANWIGPKMAVIIPEKGNVMVYDAAILNFFNKPIPASRVRKRGDAIIVAWRLKNVKDISGQKIPDFRYEARIDTTKLTVHVSAKPNSYPNRWTGRGTCQTRTAK